MSSGKNTEPIFQTSWMLMRNRFKNVSENAAYPAKIIHEPFLYASKISWKDLQK